MTDAEVTNLANAIANATVLKHWYQYLLLILCTFLGGAAGAYVSSYLRKRGETAATKADFDVLLSQLRATTDATEDIRRRISHEGWMEQQRRTTRREKLEELLKSVYEIHLWLDREKDHILFEKQPQDLPDPSYKLAILKALYFPEVADQIRPFELASLQYESWLVRHKVGLGIARLKKDYADLGVKLEAATKEFPDVYNPLLAATSQLERSATDAMRQTLGA